MASNFLGEATRRKRAPFIRCLEVGRRRTREELRALVWGTCRLQLRVSGDNRVIRTKIENGSNIEKGGGYGASHILGSSV